VPPPRVIPCLLLDGPRLVKTTRFADPVYLGDPVNTVRILSDKQVDELIVLDIGSRSGGALQYDLLRQLAGECFMPLCVGGGVNDVQQFRTLVHLGVEKVAVNTAAVQNPGLVTEASRLFGRQAVAVSIDVRVNAQGRQTVHVDGGRRDTGLDPLQHAREAERLGAGELLLTSVDREGTRKGYDLDLVARISAAVDCPVVAHGGAASMQSLAQAVAAGASAVAAGSLFSLYGPHRAALVTYPDRESILALPDA
jgi:cyclase